MSTITTIASWDAISASRSVINTNFSNLNTDKAELSGATFTGDISVPAEVYGSGWNGSNEVPTKNDLYDKIETLGSGSVATDTIWDAKGDLAGGTWANTASRLAVGTNWQVLTADSAEATGLKWSNPAGGGDALTSGTLAQFASTTSLELKGVISDETGSWALVFADTPTLVTPVLGVATATSINGATITSGTLNGSVTGTNTWDQTSIVWITGTKAQFDTAVTDGNILYVWDIISASTTAQGIIEVATSAEWNTGTDATRALSPDGFAGSNFWIRYISASLNWTTALTTSDKAYFRIPSALTGMNLVSVSATVGTGASGSSSSGVPTFTVKNVTDGNQMLSTSLTVDASEYTSATAATPAVINASFDDVVTDDLIEVACTVAGTGVTYATILVWFQLP